MNRLGNIMSINSKFIADSRSIANAISFHNVAGGLGLANDEVMNYDVRMFKQQQMAVRAMRNKNDMELFKNSMEFKIAYTEFKQKQMGVRAERNNNFVPYYKNLDIYVNSKDIFQEDDMTAI